MSKDKPSKKPSQDDQFVQFTTDDDARFKKPTQKEIDAIPADIRKKVEDAFKKLTEGK